MLVCHSCRRHYRFEDARCPFCSTPHRSALAGMGAALLSGLMLFGCTDEEEGDTSDEAETTESDSGETGDSTETDTGDSTSTDTSTDGTEYGAAPLPEPGWADQE